MAGRMNWSSFRDAAVYPYNQFMQMDEDQRRDRLAGASETGDAGMKSRNRLLTTTMLGAGHRPLMPCVQIPARLTDPKGVLKEYYQPTDRRRGGRRPQRRR